MSALQKKAAVGLFYITAAVIKQKTGYGRRFMSEDMTASRFAGAPTKLTMQGLC